MLFDTKLKHTSPTNCGSAKELVRICCLRRKVIILYYYSKVRAYGPMRCTPLPAPLRRRLVGSPPLVLCAPHDYGDVSVVLLFSFQEARRDSEAIIALLFFIAISLAELYCGALGFFLFRHLTLFIRFTFVYTAKLKKSKFLNDFFLSLTAFARVTSFLTRFSKIF